MKLTHSVCTTLASIVLAEGATRVFGWWWNHREDVYRVSTDVGVVNVRGEALQERRP
jgi:hypothetical protein